MALIYLDQHKEECKDLTGYTFEELLELSGVYGVHKDFDYERYKDECGVTLQGDIVEVDIETEDLEILQIRINLHSKTIWNTEIKSAEKRSGISFDFVIAQVIAGIKLGFKAIECQAYGDFSRIEKYNGYLIWGKYGYIMAPNNQKEFEALMQMHGRTEKSIYELSCSKGGFELWKQIGKKWLGEFSLAENSPSIVILEEVIRKKGLQVVIPGR